MCTWWGVNYLPEGKKEDDVRSFASSYVPTILNTVRKLKVGLA